jgi:hypothetical protein
VVAAEGLAASFYDQAYIVHYDLGLLPPPCTEMKEAAN